MLAIAIMAVICGTIYNFTGTVVRSASVTMRADGQEQAFAGFRRLLDAQFAAMPTNEIGTFIGVSKEADHGHRDALQIVCPAGNGVLTPDARGLYQVTVGLEEVPKGSGHLTLVMEREPWTDNDEEEVAGNVAFQLPTVSAGGTRTSRNQLPSDSVRLLAGVKALEFAYFDPRLNSWQDKWNDDTLIPSLVRVRVTMENSGAPYEFIEHVPSGGLRRGLPSSISANGIIQPGTIAVPGTNGTVPSLPPGLTVPPPPPNYPNLPNLPANGYPFNPNLPVHMPTGGSAAPR